MQQIFNLGPSSMSRLVVIFLSLLLIVGNSKALDPKIAGLISLSKGLPTKNTGPLVIEVHNLEMGLVAQTQVKSPKWPQAFSIGPKNIVSMKVPFKGGLLLKVKLFQNKKLVAAYSSKELIYPGDKSLDFKLQKIK